jgi:hypothetical protein
LFAADGRQMLTTSALRKARHSAARCGDESTWWSNAGVDPTVAARLLWLESHPLQVGQEEPTSNRTRTLIATATESLGPGFRLVEEYRRRLRLMLLTLQITTAVRQDQKAAERRKGRRS